MKKLSLLLLTTGMGLIIFAQGPGKQDTHIKDHPRVNQVNKRVDNQEKRIDNKVKDGDMSKQQARKDRKELKEINQEKKDMRKTDGGHLTKADQKALNQQLNQNSKKIKNQ